MPKRKHLFEVELEAKVKVMAFDEASARLKVERALAERKRLDDDVSATGEVWTYAVTQQSEAVSRRTIGGGCDSSEWRTVTEHPSGRGSRGVQLRQHH